MQHLSIFFSKNFTYESYNVNDDQIVLLTKEGCGPVGLQVNMLTGELTRLGAPQLVPIVNMPFSMGGKIVNREYENKFIKGSRLFIKFAPQNPNGLSIIEFDCVVPDTIEKIPDAGWKEMPVMIGCK